MFSPRFVSGVVLQATLAIVFFAAITVRSKAESIFTVCFSDLTGGPLHGGTVIVTTTIDDGAMWNREISNLPPLLEHAGTVTARVMGTGGADGLYTYTSGGFAGFNVNPQGSGALYSVAQEPLSNEVTLTLGSNTLLFYYAFDLPSDAGIENGLPVRVEQLPPVSSGTGALAYNGDVTAVGQVASLGATTVPEPGAAALLGLAAAGLTLRRFRRI